MTGPGDEMLDDATTWPGMARDAAGAPVAMLTWQPAVRAVQLHGTDTVDLVVTDLLRRGLHLVTEPLHPAAFRPAPSWIAVVEQSRVAVRDGDGRLAISMESSEPGDSEWREWHQVALHRGVVWVCAGPTLADPATGMPDMRAARLRGQLLAGAVPVHPRPDRT